MYFWSNSLCIVSTVPYELAKKSYIIDWKLTENAMRYNNRGDLLQLSFTLKISIFSEVYI